MIKSQNFETQNLKIHRMPSRTHHVNDNTFRNQMYNKSERNPNRLNK